MSKERQADVELKVRVLNINYGHNKALMDSCQTLREYAEFVMISRQYAASGMKLQTALNAAVDYCVAHGILDSTLREHRSEVLGMLLEEFDADKYERTIRMEGVQQGIQQGLQRGIQQGLQQGEEQGIQQGINRANRLTQLLLEQNRTEDLKRALEDSEYQDMLFREYDL
ncbi:MAG: hypothetical protein HDR09_08680 [Lachnospiraceae bacterium]|nr:hypothetical protein [Lachnospiraceae bacterium]